MSKRDEPNNEIRSAGAKFRNMVRTSVKTTNGFYVVMEIMKKVKFKHNGEMRLKNPAFTLLVNVVESNLPMPANNYNPIFKFKRKLRKPEEMESAPEETEYVGIATPDEYFTMPDLDNLVNSDKERGEFYLASGFTRVFDDGLKADSFLDEMMIDLQDKLNALEKFMNDNRKMLEWESYGLGGVTDMFKNRVVLLKGGGTIISFLEKSSPQQQGIPRQG